MDNYGDHIVIGVEVRLIVVKGVRLQWWRNSGHGWNLLLRRFQYNGLDRAFDGRFFGNRCMLLITQVRILSCGHYQEIRGGNINWRCWAAENAARRSPSAGLHFSSTFPNVSWPLPCPGRFDEYGVYKVSIFCHIGFVWRNTEKIDKLIGFCWKGGVLHQLQQGIERIKRRQCDISNTYRGTYFTGY